MTRLALLIGIAVVLLFIVYGIPRATSQALSQPGVQGSYGVDVRYAVRLLFRWWLLLSAGYWVLIGILYGVMNVATYRLTHQ